jgi:hypothetical protein
MALEQNPLSSSRALPTLAAVQRRRQELLAYRAGQEPGAQALATPAELRTEEEDLRDVHQSLCNCARIGQQKLLGERPVHTFLSTLFNIGYILSPPIRPLLPFVSRLGRKYRHVPDPGLA